MKDRIGALKMRALGIAVLVTAFTFGFAACGDGNDAGGGGTAPSITTTTADLPNGTTGTAYSETTLAATGDTPITWSIVSGSGSLPTGLSLAANGVITGTPSVANTFPFTVKATNAAGTDTKELSITIGVGGAPKITTEELPDGTVGMPYIHKIEATGDEPITWSIDSESDALPAGLDLDPATGVISGEPETVGGPFTFTVIATNEEGFDDKELSITISIPVTSVSLNKNTLSLHEGTGETLAATVQPAEASQSVTWVSSDPTKATVLNGLVTAVAEGTTRITVTTVGLKADSQPDTAICDVTVTVGVTSVSLNKTTLSMVESRTATLTATVLPARATNKNVTWVSSDPTKVTVVNGLLTAVAEGPATITVTTVDGGKPASCAVNVVALLEGVAAVQTFLEAQPANTADNPVFLPLKLNLGNMTQSASVWDQLLTALDTAGKFVDLDLADCTIGGTATTVFNPYSLNVETGKDKIVYITLPDTATSITAASASTNPTFRYFTALKSFSFGPGLTAIPNYAFSRLMSFTEFTLPEGITSIGTSAFSGCTNLALTELPAGITSIGQEAFYQCASLALTKLSADLITIGNAAFRECTELALTELPAGVTTIGNNAFYQCTKLALKNLPAGVTAINQNAFYRCTGLTEFTLPENLTTIGTQSFSGCTNLALTAMPPLITSIGQEAFYQCTSLKLTKLSAGLITIGQSAFSGCTELALTELPEGLTTIGPSAFLNCEKITLTAIPANVTSIGNTAFRYCAGLPQISLPAGVTSLGTQVFSHCTGLTQVSLPEVTTLGQEAFYNCTGLTQISLPKVTSIGSSAFSSCTNLLSVTFGAVIPTASFNTSSPFPGDLRAKYLADGGGVGTYTRPTTGTTGTWSKQ